MIGVTRTRTDAHSAIRGEVAPASTPTSSAPTGIAPQLTKRTVAITRESRSGGEAFWRVTEPDPLGLLTDANDQLNTATEQLTSAVLRARQHHITWAAIGTVLSTTRQAAQQRFRLP